MNKGKLYVPKGSKLYVAAVILAFAYVIIRIVVNIIDNGYLESTFLSINNHYYLGFIQATAEMCIPLGFILARKNIKFAAIGNIALFVFIAVHTFDIVALDSIGASAILLVVFPYILILPFVISGAPIIYILAGSKNKVAFTTITNISIFLYASLNLMLSTTHFSSSLVNDPIHVITHVVGPLFTLFSIIGAYLCLGLSLQNEALPPEQLKPIFAAPYQPYPFNPQYPVQYPQYYQPYSPQYQQPMVYAQPVQQPVPMQNNAQDMAQSTEQSNDQN